MRVIASDIVSSEGEELILVDDDDNKLGTLSKADCHDGDGVLHRAFSLFLFDVRGDLLLQQRSSLKRLWPLHWSNSCCSHPRNGETMQEATRRRLHQELGVAADLQFIYKFGYHARFEDIGSERELCSVFLGRIDGEVEANRNEIADVRYVQAAELTNALHHDGERYTPWFHMEWRRLNEEYGERLAQYTSPAA